MLQSMGSQRVGNDLATEQQQYVRTVYISEIGSHFWQFSLDHLASSYPCVGGPSKWP